MIGGMERLLWHIVDELRQRYAVSLVGPRGCAALLPDDVRVREVPVRPLWLFFLRTLLASLVQARNCRPNIVLAGSGLTAPFAWLAARLFGAKCIMYLHGFDAKAAYPIYRKLWMPFFRHFDQVIVNSSFTRQLAMDIGVDPQRIAILHPGVALPDMTNAEAQSGEFRHRQQLGDAPMMLYVGRITARKGLLFFAEHILPSIAREIPTARLVVIGDNPTESAQDHGDECGRVREALARNELEDRVLFFGPCNDDTVLSGAYFAADVLIFPLQQNAHDVEGFGMVALEAAAHGLPTVAFAFGGVVDAIKDNVSGRLVPPNDTKAVETFTQATLQYLHNRQSPDQSIRNFAEPFCWSRFGDGLRRIVGKDESSSSS